MDSTTDELIVFLRATLDDDERIARAAIADDGGQDGGFEDATEELTSGRFHLPRFAPAAARMITTYAVPRRVLTEVDAKRRILDLHAPDQNGFKYLDRDTRVPNMRCTVCHLIPADVDYDNPPYADEFPCPTVRLLALPYADRPGYRSEWAP